MANSFNLNVHIWKQISLEIRDWETGCRKMGGRARRPDIRVELTNLSRNVFSRSAPMHPANPRMNITPPTTINSQTGSKPPRSVMEEMFDSTPCGTDTSDRAVVSSHPDLKILHHPQLSTVIHALHVWISTSGWNFSSIPEPTAGFRPC